MTKKRYNIEYDSNCYMCIVDCEKKVLYTDRKKIVQLLNEQNEKIQHITKTLQSFSKRDLVDIERIFLNNLCKELGVDLNDWMYWL